MPYTCKDCLREFADDPAPDPRDEAVRVLREALIGMVEPHEKGWRVTDWGLRLDAARAALAATEPKK